VRSKKLSDKDSVNIKILDNGNIEVIPENDQPKTSIHLDRILLTEVDFHWGFIHSQPGYWKTKKYKAYNLAKDIYSEVFGVYVDYGFIKIHTSGQFFKNLCDKQTLSLIKNDPDYIGSEPEDFPLKGEILTFRNRYE